MFGVVPLQTGEGETWGSLCLLAQYLLFYAPRRLSTACGMSAVRQPGKFTSTAPVHWNLAWSGANSQEEPVHMW